MTQQEFDNFVEQHNFEKHIFVRKECNGNTTLIENPAGMYATNKLTGLNWMNDVCSNEHLIFNSGGIITTSKIKTAVEKCTSETMNRDGNLRLVFVTTNALFYSDFFTNDNLIAIRGFQRISIWGDSNLPAVVGVSEENPVCIPVKIPYKKEGVFISKAVHFGIPTYTISWVDLKVCPNLQQYVKK